MILASIINDYTSTHRPTIDRLLSITPLPIDDLHQSFSRLETCLSKLQTTTPHDHHHSHEEEECDKRFYALT
jgi:hypothetical protein